MTTYWLVYLGAVAVSLPATLVAIRLARAAGAMDAPGARKVHTRPVPRIGGIGVATAAISVVLGVLAADNAVGRAFRQDWRQVAALLTAAGFVFAIGLVDDLRGLRARHKLLAQLAAAAAVCAAGLRIDALSVPGLFQLRLGLLGWPVTVVWIVGITNAINLIDGLDGLAAGIAAVTCAVIAAFSLHSGQAVMAVIMLALLGGLSGFLVFGFHPARVFLGDCGSLFLGFLLAGASVLSSMKSATAVGLALPMLAMGLPIFDTLTSMVRRLVERRSLFSPDRNHLHHRLLRLGLRQRQAVLVLYGVTLLTAGLGMFMMITRNVETLVVFAGAVALLVGVLRVLGVVRIRAAIRGVRESLALGRRLKEARRDYESAGLPLGEAGGFEEWWVALCRAAERLRLERLVLSVTGEGWGCRSMTWTCPGGSRCEKVIRLRLPCGPECTMAIEVPVGGCLELAGHRAMLFLRLANEHGPEKFRSAEAALAAPRAAA